MPQPKTDRFRDVGLAEHRYVQEGELACRQQVARYLREIAQHNHSDWILPGWEKAARHALSLKKQADRYETCGLEYAMIGCRECGHLLIGRRRCETRICEWCARKYAARIRRKQVGFAKQLQYKAGKRAMFLTLTKKAHPMYRPEASDARRLFRGFRKLMKKLWPKKHGCGAFAVLEVGKNHNLHIHALIYGHYVPQDTISKLWLKITGDSSVVWINEVRGAKRCINYLLKYITKPHKYKDPKDTAHFLDMMIGVRRIRTYGIFYNYPLARKDACPCPLCGGKLRYCGTDEGRRIPKHALFFDEAMKLAETTVN